MAMILIVVLRQFRHTLRQDILTNFPMVSTSIFIAGGYCLGRFRYCSDSDQRQVKIPKLGYDPPQSGLIDDQTGQPGHWGIVALDFDGQPVEPFGPAFVQSSLYLDLVDRLSFCPGGTVHRGASLLDQCAYGCALGANRLI